MGYYGLGPGTKVPDQLTGLEKALRSVPVACYEVCLDTLEKLIKNVAQNPAEPKFRRVNLANERIKAAVTSVEGAVTALLECGFVFEKESNSLVLPPGVKLTFPAHVVKVQEARDVLKKEEEKERVAKGLSRVAPVRAAGEKPVDKRDAADVAGASDVMIQRLRGPE